MKKICLYEILIPLQIFKHSEFETIFEVFKMKLRPGFVFCVCVCAPHIFSALSLETDRLPVSKSSSSQALWNSVFLKIIRHAL